jgi:sugar phosphate isomerase/epimerase
MMNNRMTRRRFLGATAAVGAGAVLGLPRRATAAQSGGKSMFSIGIQSYSLRGYPVDEALRHAKEMGFEHVEFFRDHFDPASTPQQIDAMKSKMAGLNLKMLGHGVNRFTKDHEANRKFFEFAKRAGIRNLSADPTADAFDSLDKLVAEFDVRIAIHNHGPSARYDKVVDVVQAVKGRHPNIGACADLGHYIRSGEDPVEVIRVLDKRLFGIHLKDFAEQADKTKGVILGKGHLDVEGVFRALRQVQFPADGCLSLEYEENPKDPLDDIRQCLAIAREAAIKASA